jgi:hypothetical protein
MSDTDDSSVGTSQTSQTSRKSNSSKYSKKNNYNQTLRGNIAELGNKVYTYGHRNQGDWYVKTTEAIGDYVGRELGKEMRMLVIYKTESPPTEPEEPENDKKKFVVEKYKVELNNYYKKLEEYNANKAKVFVIIKGQCNLTIKNKLENNSDYKDWEKNDDVIKLLETLKELSFSSKETQYEFWTMNQAIRNVHTMRQENGESLVAYYKRFINTVDVAESRWGLITPTKKGNDKETRNKYLACTFLTGVDQRRYGKLINDLNNSFLAGQNNYPKTLEGAVTLLSHYATDKDKPMSKYRGANDDGSITQMSFAQGSNKNKNVKCYKCGKKGHYANKCGEESDDDFPITSTKGRHNKGIGWT